MGTRLSISARIIHWPNRCACCMENADTWHHARASREKGVKVIHVESKKWKIPYCRHCLEHADLFEERDEITDQKANGILFVGILSGIVAILIGGFCGSLLLRHVQENNGFPPILAVIAGMIFFFGGVGSIIGTVVLTRRMKRKNADLRKQLTTKAKSLQCPTCRSDIPAVEYEGWSGSIHTFWFANPNFAKDVKQLNAEKVLD